ncbi:MAG: hypothetical protein GY743_18425 [Planctomycetaceae bacterium]|nr:hypothetical protein [Planctomycetaceae bacterium]
MRRMVGNSERTRYGKSIQSVAWFFDQQRLQGAVITRANLEEHELYYKFTD